ncbi:MAG: hypothetical protein WCG29_14460, partial [Desulfomonile sp.]
SALEQSFPKLREIKASNPEYLARCAQCFLKGLCEQCPAKSWMEHDSSVYRILSHRLPYCPEVAVILEITCTKPLNPYRELLDASKKFTQHQKLMRNVGSRNRHKLHGSRCHDGD